MGLTATGLDAMGLTAMGSWAQHLAKPGPDECGVQLGAERSELVHGLRRSSPATHAALAGYGWHELRQQAHLPVGGGPVGPQVAGVQPEPGELTGDPGDSQRLRPVVAVRAYREQSVLLELGQARLVQSGPLNERSEEHT